MFDLRPLSAPRWRGFFFMKPFELSAYKLAKDIDIPVSRIQDLVAERRAITGDTTLRLARYFGTTPEFGLNLQRDYDLELAEIEVGDQVAAKVHPKAA